ncbi:hypothetical protein PORY_001435 [Pneumocystis oryctolagi]|uniref:Uncharacterized protein n=1 Tax=Pneumocystis oryctolagi TaxID=42067 RepID=A0ACB7CD22_9ASCO|nr:hypothetical protein PORY_001435 [Pneumocystis oryctolagi]
MLSNKKQESSHQALSKGIDRVINRVSNLTFYDLKSSLILEYRPIIYRRFTEKTAEEWRQIYKALQLLDFLVKHGSERVIDDVRSHISIIKILRNFHYIDVKGRDHGINVSNRAKELVQLLSDNELLKQERKKAKMNKEKYTGVGSDDIKYNSNDRKYDCLEYEKSTTFNDYDETICSSKKSINEIKEDVYNVELPSHETSIPSFEEYNEFHNMHCKTYMQPKNSHSYINSKTSTICSKNSACTTTNLFSLMDSSFSSKEVKSHEDKGFNVFDDSLDSSIDDKFDEFHSAALPPKSENVDFKCNDDLISQLSNDSFVVPKKYISQSNKFEDQLLCDHSLGLQSQHSFVTSFTNFDNENICIEKPQDNISNPISLEHSKAQSHDAFSSLWTIALNKGTNKPSANTSESTTIL